jgi:hypothetical protein
VSDLYCPKSGVVTRVLRDLQTTFPGDVVGIGQGRADEHMARGNISLAAVFTAVLILFLFILPDRRLYGEHFIHTRI